MSPLARGMCVEFTLSSQQRVRGQLREKSRQTGHWWILGDDVEWYERPDSSLQRITGTMEKTVKRKTDMLLRTRPKLARQLHHLMEPQPYVPRRRMEPDRKTRFGGWDGMPGYGAKPGDTSHGGLERYEIPMKLHDRDRQTAVGPDWTPEFERRMCWGTGAYMSRLESLYRDDPRLKRAYQLCVEDGHPSSEAALIISEEGFAVSPATVRRLRAHAERRMAGTRRRLA